MAARDTTVDVAIAPEVTQFGPVARALLLPHARARVHVLALAPARAPLPILRIRDTAGADLKLGLSVVAEEATVGTISETADLGLQRSISGRVIAMSAIAKMYY